MARHEPRDLGIPYGSVGVDDLGRATCTCPICGEVFTGRTHKDATRAYAVHYARATETEGDGDG